MFTHLYMTSGICINVLWRHSYACMQSQPFFVMRPCNQMLFLSFHTKILQKKIIYTCIVLSGKTGMNNEIAEWRTEWRVTANVDIWEVKCEGNFFGNIRVNVYSYIFGIVLFIVFFGISIVWGNFSITTIFWLYQSYTFLVFVVFNTCVQYNFSHKA